MLKKAKKAKVKINLLKISFTITLIGILLLLFMTNTLKPAKKDIINITSKDLNKEIQISGQITNVRTYNESDFQIITIKDSTGEINAIINKNSNLTNISNITVTGEVQEYKSKLQISANKIISFS